MRKCNIVFLTAEEINIAHRDLICPSAGGYSLLAGQVIVAEGTPEAAKRIERVLTTNPGMGVIRHVDAGYTEAIEFARENSIKVPMSKK